MQLSRSLVGWYFQAVQRITLIASLVAASFAVFYTGRLADVTFAPLAFITIQSVVAAWLMTQFNSPAVAFLYTRGFTRDRLWVHRIATHLLSILAVWGPASLLVWLGVRSAIQDRLIENPYYPLMRSADFAVPWRWLAVYLLLVGLVEYGPIRRVQPALDRDAGYTIEFGLLILLLMVAFTPARNPWFYVPVTAALVMASATLLVGSWRLHRQIEIRP